MLKLYKVGSIACVCAMTVFGLSSVVRAEDSLAVITSPKAELCYKMIEENTKCPVKKAIAHLYVTDPSFAELMDSYKSEQDEARRNELRETIAERVKKEVHFDDMAKAKLDAAIESMRQDNCDVHPSLISN